MYELDCLFIHINEYLQVNILVRQLLTNTKLLFLLKYNIFNLPFKGKYSYSKTHTIHSVC